MRKNYVWKTKLFISIFRKIEAYKDFIVSIYLNLNKTNNGLNK